MHAGVTVRSYKVIYDLLDDMRAAMEGKLAALEQRIPLGEAEVRAVFGKGSKLVAGCMVTEGSLRENCFVVVSCFGLAEQFEICTLLKALCSSDNTHQDKTSRLHLARQPTCLDATSPQCTQHV